MARVKGAVVTARDRVLISYVAVARYASAPQLYRLIADGRDISLMYRRLRRLSSETNRPGESPPLRRIEFKRSEGTAVAVWTLTQYGRAVAEDVVQGAFVRTFDVDTLRDWIIVPQKSFLNVPLGLLTVNSFGQAYTTVSTVRIALTSSARCASRWTAASTCR